MPGVFVSKLGKIFQTQVDTPLKTIVDYARLKRE